MGNEMVVETIGVDSGNLINEGAALSELLNKDNKKAVSGEILFVTSYPPRECGIASYSQNLMNALNSRFNDYCKIKVCALENSEAKYYYPGEVTLVLNTTVPSDYGRVAADINKNAGIQAIVIQHEFDLFKPNEQAFLHFLKTISKPKVVVFHKVMQLPTPDLKRYVQSIAAESRAILVMAKVSENILINDYQLASDKIEVIPYGTHLVTPLNVAMLKDKYKLTGRTVISTIGLLAHGKGIENTLEALPAIIKEHPEIIFLIVGKTHPEELKKEGERYRIMLESRVKSLKLQNHVRFFNGFFTTDILKEYFQLTDICIFSCTDANRPMSGMFSLAVSCGCAIMSTPTSHAFEFLGSGEGIIYQNENNEDLTSKINKLLNFPEIRREFSESVLRKSNSAIWENSALLHGKLLNKITGDKLPFELAYPPIKLDFIRQLTDRVGILKTAYKGEPDIRTGYTLDDNALALFVFCMHYKNTRDTSDLLYINKYLKFIYHCLQPSGTFFNYMDYERKFTVENYKENLEETQSKAVWALGYLYSMKGLLPSEITEVAGLIMKNILLRADTFVSGKAIALTIKGLYYYYSAGENAETLAQIKTLANKLVAMYYNKAREDWMWFEDTFPDSASILPNGLLNSWLITGEQVYKDIAKESFQFLSSKFFNSNKARLEWSSSDPAKANVGEHPCDIAFNIVTLSKFYLVCKESEYFDKMDTAYKWFLGNNRLNQMIYNPETGSCFDGLDGDSVSLHQSAESALSYALARMVVAKYKFIGENHINQKE